MSGQTVVIPVKYAPLFEVLGGTHSAVDTVLMTGGRGSGKSFAVALFSLIGLRDHDYKVLYSRFTGVSIEDSVAAEVSSKIPLLGYDNLQIKNNSIEKNGSDSKISFKGIKTGSGFQTANLKSLQGFNIFIVDEAEEIPDFETFEKVFFSIRSRDKQNISILILNPTYRQHWIYKKFYSEVDEGFNGIKDNVMYIHTSYLDVLEASPGAIPDNIVSAYDRMKVDEPERYRLVVMGGWDDITDEQVFTEDSLNFYSHLPDAELVCKLSYADIADSGTDNHSVPVGYLYVDGRIFIEDVVFTKLPTSDNVVLTADLLNKHKVDYARIESNFGGTMYIQLLASLVQSTELYDARATTNKHGRILMRQWDIKKNVYFRRDYRTFSDDYRLFMENLFEYTKDGKAKFDDAADSIEGLVTFARAMYGHLY